MVGPLTILKILHCKNMTKATVSRSLKKDIKQKAGSITAGGSGEGIRNEQLCRVCLREGTIPIFGQITAPEDLVEALNIIGGIEVSFGDSYPKHLCQPCHALLQGAILFRKTAQQSEKQLKSKSKNELVTDLVTCDEFSNFADDYDNSHQSESKEKNRKYPTCKRCDIQFNTYQEYTDHKLSAEHENKKIICPVCNNSYHPQYMKRHMKYHDAKTAYVCDFCGKYFTKREHFYRHHETHFYSLPHQCSLCPYKGRFPESLKMHMRSHTGEKPYQCDQCSRRFINKSNLNKHLLHHTGKHDFRCETCGRGFYTKRELEMHFKVVHTGVKEHICPICDKAFGYRKQMMKHQLKVHKREKLRSGRTPIYLQVEQMKQQENYATSKTNKFDIII